MVNCRYNKLTDAGIPKQLFALSDLSIVVSWTWGVDAWLILFFLTVLSVQLFFFFYISFVCLPSPPQPFQHTHTHTHTHTLSVSLCLFVLVSLCLRVSVFVSLPFSHTFSVCCESVSFCHCKIFYDCSSLDNLSYYLLDMSWYIIRHQVMLTVIQVQGDGITKGRCLLVCRTWVTTTSGRCHQNWKMLALCWYSTSATMSKFVLAIAFPLHYSVCIIKWSYGNIWEHVHTLQV